MEHNLQFLNRETADQYQKMMDHNFIWPGWEPSVEKIDDGIIVPAEAFYDEVGNYRYRGGVLNAEGEFVESSGLYKGLDYRKELLSMAECPDVNLDNCVYIDEEVVYYGLFIYHWGHFLFESTNRLWYYLRENCKASGVRLAGIYLNKKPDGNFRLFHDLVGIEQDDLLFLDRPTRFKRIIVPKASCILGSTNNFYYSKEFLIPFDKIIDSVPANPSRKVYLTRTNLQESNTIGEKKIEDNFRRNGFDIVAPENESLLTMVSLLKEADVVAGLSGSNTHNLLFSGSKCKAIILNRMQDTNYPQEMVHQSRNIQAVYIDVYSTFMPVTHGNGPFLVSVNDHLFNYQINVRMLPYHYSTYLSYDSIIKFLHKWSIIYHKTPSAANILNLYFNNIKDIIEKAYLFFLKNEQGVKQKKLSKKISLFLWLHRLGLKKIYEVVNTDKSSLSDLNIIRYSYYFNERWYRKKYMVKINDSEPAAHYLNFGFREGNDPSPRFSTRGYFRLYPDIQEAGINPLWHYEKHGKFEGRQVVQSSNKS
ncbi:glycosyltransferase family 61 protein [Paenibacillus sp. PSB04]|uniref:glycosyltransferase family 61 protein n=1 Tax=Paenibacillus sp. PSB04 TaxID=2866810 RepID=UPI0021F20CDE|nr:glycosyltransferase family 61 protein [Paenibacillus sp. PSB04]UYO05154.1 glycosyltransferase family 61 protein [Paenibacillus sp. PSB04]